MQMAAGRVEHRAQVERAVEHLPGTRAVPPFQRVVIALGHPHDAVLQGLHLARFQRHMGVTVAPVAGDGMTRDARAQQVHAVAREVEQQPRVGIADQRFRVSCSQP